MGRNGQWYWRTKRNSKAIMCAFAAAISQVENGVPPVMTISESEEVVEDVVYPYPLMDENEIMNSNEWTKDEELWKEMN